MLPPYYPINRSTLLERSFFVLSYFQKPKSQLVKNCEHSREMAKWLDPSPQLIQRFRILSGMTIAEAAQVMKTDPSVVSNWENGKHKPTSKSLNKLAKAYERDVSEFYEVDVATVRAEATSDLMGYFRDPEANKDRKASIASQLLIHLPDIDNPIEVGAKGQTLEEFMNEHPTDTESETD